MNSLNSSAASLTRLLSPAAIEAEILRRKRNKIATFFPDTGNFRRELYPKHVEFFEAGSKYKERLFMAANRVGKSESGAYETACHLTGKYPHWWTGKRFRNPIEAWACGTTTETTRDIVQSKLFGPVNAIGTGMIPGDLIGKTTARSGTNGGIETAWIRHVSGGTSLLGLKTYQQGRPAFEGTAKHVIWCDEEPPLDCYTEMLFRTATTGGIVLTTFTPLQGRSDVVNSFLEPENEAARDFKWYIQAGWDHVPHIPEYEKQALIATTPPYQLDARTKGEPSLGAGAIYPIPESEIAVEPFPIPDEWPRAYGMDVGWNRTAVIWGAKDPASGVVYLYSEHYQGQGEPPSHAAAIKGRGEWIPGVIDPACLGSSQIDGRTLMDIYSKLGLDLQPAVNAVEAGIAEVWQLLVGGRMKIMRNCQSWFAEFRKYHRDDKGNGKIVKRDDHLMDATRYLCVSGRERMKTKPVKKKTEHRFSAGGSGWMAG
jgi:phage terminase large subunit-like protein